MMQATDQNIPEHPVEQELKQNHYQLNHRITTKDERTFHYFKTKKRGGGDKQKILLFKETLDGMFGI